MVPYALLPNFLFFLTLTQSQPVLLSYSICLSSSSFPDTTGFSVFQPIKKGKPVGLHLDVCHSPSCILTFNHHSSGFVPIIPFFLFHFCLPLLCLPSLLLTHHTHQTAFNAFCLAKPQSRCFTLTLFSPSGPMLFLKFCPPFFLKFSCLLILCLPH